MLEQGILELYVPLQAKLQASVWPDTEKKVFRQSDLESIERAFVLAAEAHGAQRRDSGEPYMTHPVAVTEILLGLGMYDRSSLMAALLHDVLEDTDLLAPDLQEHFGPQVTQLVEGLTKLRNLPLSVEEEERPPETRREEAQAHKEEVQAQNILKMLLAMSKDPRVIIVKLADRLHNMRTLHFKPVEAKRREIARETLKIYVPIADMLGIRLFKEELEDLAFRYMDPFGYHEIEEMLKLEKEARSAALQRIQDRLGEYLGERFTRTGVPNTGDEDAPRRGLHLEGRVKSVRGIYRKVNEQGRKFEDIYDIYAVRVIVDTLEECWTVFGLIQDIYHPIPERYKNFISSPKGNGYQSIHLTVRGEEGIAFEVQIRTWDMHELAEYGVAAHWKYKQGLGKNRTGLEKQLGWVRELLESFRDSESAEEVMHTLQTDYAPPEKIYVYSPKGRLFELPRGANVIDFAYAVHTEIGNCMTGAKVNTRMVSLDHTLEMCDTVQILTTQDKTRGPNREWLRIAKTTRAQSKIRNWFKVMCRPENIREGRMQVERELRRNFIRLEPEEQEEILRRLIEHKAQYSEPEDFYAAIGYGGDSLQRYLPRLKEEFTRLTSTQQQEDEPNITKKISSDKGVIVEGINNCLIHFAHCCHPLPGDSIVGYVTRGKGLAIHKIECVNVPSDPSLSPEPDRWLRARWTPSEHKHYVGALFIRSVDITGMNATLSSFFTANHVDISHWQMLAHPDKTATISAGVGVGSREQLNSIVERLRKIEGVIDVRY
jgi:GTP pyrophosphokinase